MPGPARPSALAAPQRAAAPIEDILNAADFPRLLLPSLALIGLYAWGLAVEARAKRAPSFYKPIDGVLSLAALFFIFGATLLAGTAVWRWGRLLSVRDHWVPVDAEVLRSDLVKNRGGAIRRPYEWDPEERRFTRDFFGVDTVFRYAAAGREREAKLYSCCHPSRTRAERWLAMYTPGSRRRVYYPPEDPARISLAGADEAIASATPRNGARQSLMFAVLGCLFFYWGAVLLARRNP